MAKFIELTEIGTAELFVVNINKIEKIIPAHRGCRIFVEGFDNSHNVAQCYEWIKEEIGVKNDISGQI